MSPAVADELLTYVARERANMPATVLETLVLGAYQRHAISAGTSANLLGMPLQDFLRLASDAGIAVLDQTPEELDADLRRLGS